VVSGWTPERRRVLFIRPTDRFQTNTDTDDTDMTDTNDTDMTDREMIEKKLEIIGSVLPEERVEALRAELDGDTDDGPERDIEGDTLEALSAFEDSTLRSRVALENEISHRKQKLALVGDALPETRVEEVEEELAAAQLARDNFNPHLQNTAEALAERAGVDE
jgi:hypothetical protein